MASHRSLIDSKSPQVSNTLLSILADLDNAIVWKLSTRPLISKSSSPFTNPLVTVRRATITIDITVTFMFHSHLNSLARSRHFFFFFSLSCNFTQWSAGTAKSTIWQVLVFFFFFFFSFFFCFFLLTITRSDRLVKHSLQVFHTSIYWGLSNNKSP